MSNKVTALSLILEAAEKKSKSLKFYSIEEQTLEIPKQLFELVDLEELDLTYAFTLDTIPVGLHKLEKLNHITFVWNSAEFPLELLKLKSLKMISITSEQLENVPKTIELWDQITYLNLGNCAKLSEIQGLPKRLEYLFLNGQMLRTIPDLIFKLPELRKLVLSHFSEKSLPLGIFELPNLSSLFYMDSELNKLPKEILKLSKLRTLWLSNNNFKTFPKILTRCTQLEDINFRSNLLKTLPNEFQNLKNIKSLELDSNKFNTIPKCIFELEGLEDLSFGNFSFGNNHQSKNAIKIIPLDLLNLKNLKSFSVRENPIENIPEEIRDDIEALRNFLRSKIEADKEEYLYEAKMVVVGRGDVGKTVLTKKLTTPGYSLDDSKTTVGIDVLKNPFLLSMNGLKDSETFRFNIWDFGGQEKYDATHQLFITNRSIYLFLTEARSESNYHDVYYWLNTISLLSSNSPVIVILSKYDERKKTLPETIYKEKFQNIVDFVDVSCASGYEFTIENLKNSINSAVKLLPQTKLTLSNHWVDIRNQLEDLSKTQDYIDYEIYLKICAQNKLDKERADFLSEYLNDLGVIIHHKFDILLKKTVFINTDWCVDGMYKVLDHNIVFDNNGKFTDEDLENIWNEERFKNKQAELIRLMIDYGLCFRLNDQSGYICPDLLPLDKPQTLEWDNEGNLKFEYQYTFMPAGMISRFIVKSHSLIKSDLYWKYGVVLTYDQTSAIIEEDYINNKIRISLNGNNKKGLLSAIKIFIDEVHHDFDKYNKLTFEEMVPCNCRECLRSGSPHFYKFQVLKKFEQKSITEIHCEKSGDLIQIKSLINDVQVRNPLDYFETSDDLRVFLFQLLDEVLEKEVGLKDGYMNFWRDKKFVDPKDEIEIQPYICNTLDNYCKVRGVNLAREVRQGNGNVDVLFSCTTKKGKILRVCMEIKKAHHQDVEGAIASQLPVYMKSCDTNSGIYLVIWFKNENFKNPNKYKSSHDLQLVIEQNNLDSENISVKIINCSKQISPSKIVTST